MLQELGDFDKFYPWWELAFEMSGGCQGTTNHAAPVEINSFSRVPPYPNCLIRGSTTHRDDPSCFLFSLFSTPDLLKNSEEVSDF